MENQQQILLGAGLIVAAIAAYCIYVTYIVPTTTSTTTPTGPVGTNNSSITVSPNPVSRSTYVGSVVVNGKDFKPLTMITFTANGTTLSVTVSTDINGSFTNAWIYPGGGIVDNMIANAGAEIYNMPLITGVNPVTPVTTPTTTTVLFVASDGTNTANATLTVIA